MKILLSFLSLILVSLSVFSQAIDTTYFSKIGFQCDADTAHYYQIRTTHKQACQVEEYYTSNGQLKSTGKELNLSYFSLKEGKWKTYFENGQIEEEAVYKKGSKLGSAREWHPNGQLKAYWEELEEERILMYAWDSTGTRMVDLGSGTLIRKYPNGQIRLQGKIIGGKQQGLWQAWHPNGKLMYQVYATDGVCLGEEQIFDATGKKIYSYQRDSVAQTSTISYFFEDGSTETSTEASPEPLKVRWFDIGDQEPQPLNMYDVKRSIGYPVEARDNGIQGEVILRVLVGKNGQYLKHKIYEEGPNILQKAVENHIPQIRFTPAIQGGEFIKFWVNIPFRFKLLN